MRILTVTNMYPTTVNPQHGIFVHEQVESIRALGHDVDVLFINSRAGRLRHKAYPLGVPRLWSALLRKRYDVVHAHYILAGLVARAQLQVPVVLTHHGPELHDPVQGRLCRWTRNAFDELIVVAKWMGPFLGAPDAHVIPCGMDLSLFRPLPQDEVRRTLGLETNRRYVLFAGNYMNPRKRFPLVEEAVARLQQRYDDIELLKVRRLPHDQVPLYMNAADVLVAPSVSEGGPLVVKEAMACGTPVISTDVGDAAEVIGDTQHCFIVNPDVAEIAARIEQAITPAKRTDGPQRIHYLALDNIARRVVAVYDAAYARGRRHITVSTRDERGVEAHVD